MRENTLQLKLVSALTDVQYKVISGLEKYLLPAADVHVLEDHKNVQEKQ